MEEFKIVTYTALHLINQENAVVKQICVSNKNQKQYLLDVFKENNISIELCDKIEIKTKEEDILAYYQFKTRRTQKVITVEAKGGDVFYNFYTMLGQFICLKKSPSSFYWFAFALPASWKTKIKNTLLNNGKIKPLISDIIKNYTKNGQGLWFYFVDDDFTIEKITWKNFLNNKGNINTI
jgi:hypothetical protein